MYISRNHFLNAILKAQDNNLEVCKILYAIYNKALSCDIEEDKYTAYFNITNLDSKTKSILNKLLIECENDILEEGHKMKSYSDLVENKILLKKQNLQYSRVGMRVHN